jgi:hydrogenase expression/formation protein HypD
MIAALDESANVVGRPLTFMEVCGTHTMSAARAGLPSLLPEAVRLLSGPGCPVCVTPVQYVDHALALAALPGIVIATFGDMMRVPGSQRGTDPGRSLVRARADGANVQLVYSPRDGLRLARERPHGQVVLLGVGFETTAPAVAATIIEAAREGVDNFSVLTAHRTIPEAMEALVCGGELRLDGFLCPGHVSVVIGLEPYQRLVARHRIPCAIAGFEPLEMLRGLAALSQQVASGKARVDNCYPGAVSRDGNRRAREVMNAVFEPIDGTWRGLGTIPASTLWIRDEHAMFDAARRFPVTLPEPIEPAGCRCGEVLRGALMPAECELFGRACTPEAPRGACMVSSEGTCAAHHRYGGSK